MTDWIDLRRREKKLERNLKQKEMGIIRDKKRAIRGPMSAPLQRAVSSLIVIL